MGNRVPNRIRYSTLTCDYAGTLAPLSYTQEELNSLCYYKGAVNNIVLSDNESNLRDFYAVTNAYEAINVLLYPGISNEKVRIIDERRKIFPELLDNMAEILKVYENLATAIYKYTYSHHSQTAIRVRRFDRQDSLNTLKQGQTCAFMSTTLAPDLGYFHKKKGLILEEIEAPAIIEHIDINDVLGNQCDFAVEQEILFPPFLILNLESRELNEQEQTYKDYEGNPPAGKYFVQFTGTGIEPVSMLKSAKQIEELKAKILRNDKICNAKIVWNLLIIGKQPDKNQEKLYEEWKADVRAYVKLIFCRAKGCIGQTFSQERQCCFGMN